MGNYTGVIFGLTRSCRKCGKPGRLWCFHTKIPCPGRALSCRFQPSRRAAALGRGNYRFPSTGGRIGLFATTSIRLPQAAFRRLKGKSPASKIPSLMRYLSASRHGYPGRLTLHLRKFNLHPLKFSLCHYGIAAPETGDCCPQGSYPPREP